MLVEFRVENHRSLRDEQVFTMEAGLAPGSAEPRPHAIRVPGYSKGLLPVALLYGANASGKSNVLSALAYMRAAVFESHRLWSPDEGIPRDPFKWGTKGAEPSMFEVAVIARGVRYRYGFIASDQCFLEEWLYAWPNGKKQVWFERDGNEFKFGDALRRAETKLIEDVTRPNALFLSVAAQHGSPPLRDLYTWFRSVAPVNVGRNRDRRVGIHFREESLIAHLLSENMEGRQNTLFDDKPAGDLIDRLRNLMIAADFGILDFRVNQAETESDRVRRPRIDMKHRAQSDDAWLPLDQESRGTQTMFRLALPILRAIESGGVLIVDELEASLHPVLARKIVELFNSHEANPHNAQLICTTHDTNLLGTTLGAPILRRDQVWLTEKDPTGGSVLYPLTDFKPRKSENLERGYLQGRYGAIPFLGDLSALPE